MRRLSILLLAVLFIVSGCQLTGKNDEESVKIYESYIDAVINNQGIESKNIPFDYKMYVYKQKDDTYKYEIEISNPQVAMYNIQAIAVDQEIDSNSNIYPCLGILGDDGEEAYHMIPYQAYGEKGYIKGFVLDAVSRKQQFTVNVMVTWKDAALRTTSRAFFNCNYAQEKGDDEKGQKETSDSGKSEVAGKDS